MEREGFRDRAALSESGCIQLFEDKAQYEQYSTQQSITPDSRGVFLSKPELDEREPWLQAVSSSSVLGGEFTSDGARANCAWFTTALAEVCQEKLGVQFWLNTEVLGFDTTLSGPMSLTPSRKITHISTSQGTIPLSDDTQVVVAAGSWTPELLYQLQLYTPVYPLRGYSLVLTAPRTAILPNATIISKYLYITSFHRQLRAASVGEFAGWSNVPTPSIMNDLRQEMKRYFPKLEEEIDTAPILTGLRPYVADGGLIVGAVPEVPNLFVNVGPGFNGWKIAIGAGELVTRAMLGPDLSNSCSIDFDESLFQPKDRVRYSPALAQLRRIANSFGRRLRDTDSHGR